MESFGRENLSEMNLGGIDLKIEKKDENEGSMEELLKDYLFKQKEDFKPKHLKRLAGLESYFHAPKKNLEWGNKETERCELRKGLESSLLGKPPEEVARYWVNSKSEYLSTYGRVEEAEDRYESLKSGILNEIIANKILQNLGFKVAITSSMLDMRNKIDLIGFCERGKAILAIQVKSNSRKNIERDNGQVIEEVKPDVRELGKRDFLKGYLVLKKELKQKDREIEVKNIWLIIPTEDKIGDGAEYNPRLEKEIKEGFGRILNKKF